MHVCEHNTGFLQVYKDPMHGYDHGVAININKAIIRKLHQHVQKLMQLLPFVLDGLADKEIAEHRASGGARVPDPIPDVIMAVNEWLHWYHLARTLSRMMTTWPT